MLQRLAPLTAVLTLALAAGASAAAPVTVDSGSLAGVRDLGRATASTRVDIAVVLNYHNESQLDSLLDAQADPSSPTYHHFLSSSQFANYFSPTNAEYAHVISALQGAGFTITHTFPNRTVVDASAPAPVAARYFNTDIHRVLQPGVGYRYTNVRGGIVPASIAPEVLGVLGLDAIHRLQPQHAFLPHGATPLVRSMAHQNSAPIFGPDSGYGPQVFIQSYDLPAAKGDTGTGRTSGVATDADFLDTDLAAYLSYFEVTRTGPATTRVPVDGGPSKGLSEDSVETTLDVETIVSLAPGTALYVYEGPFSETLSNFIDIYNQAVSDNKVDQLNSSYSECETAFIPTFPKAADHVEKQGSALGITFHSATGDYGTTTYGCSSGVSIGTPADTPHNIAVGGTRMAVNSEGQETSEIGWNDNSGATGGGVSVVFTKIPGFQKKVTTIIAGGRNIPDLSFDASPYTGESFYYDGSFQGPIGGTSLASPIFGASITEIDQIQNGRSGWFNKKLYKTWLKHGYSSGSTVYFRDITQGSIPPYEAGPGYDQMTGIGTMQVSNFQTLL